jgi:hypothetical protein
MPSTGFRLRFAMPVLNDLEEISRMAVPVVSDPVPAVVGTDHENEASLIIVIKVIHTGYEWPEWLGYRKAFANWGIDKIHQVRVLIDSEAMGVMRIPLTI